MTDLVKSALIAAALILMIAAWVLLVFIALYVAPLAVATISGIAAFVFAWVGVYAWITKEKEPAP